MTTNNLKVPIHPGRYIKEKVLPEGLSVKDAAKTLNVGRPALSNLLNEKASLSPEMAVRIEKAFGTKRDKLITLQAKHDEFLMHERAKEIAVRTHARSFVVIYAANIEAWSERIEARSLLSVLLRKLVNVTGTNLSHVDFPGFDNAQRKGWDGQVETDTATPWIPLGKSGWEFGCSKNPLKKAESDYQARLGMEKNERKQITFVFVTPRNWPKKDEWANEKTALGEWKEVKAFDASDLEQWLEQSAVTQNWMGEQLGINSDDLLSLDQCWQQWAGVTDPELNKELFQDSVQTHKVTLENWLKAPPLKPLFVTATSDVEALAFLACLIEELGGVLGEYYDRTIAIRSVNAFKLINKAPRKIIALITAPEIERHLVDFHKREHTIIIRNQNSVEGEVDIALDLPSYETFKSSLSAMGFDDNEIERYARESGQYPTILRRRLSQVPGIKEPPWIKKKEIVRQLIPLTFAGVWKSDVKADQEILSYLSGEEYSGIEHTIAEILQLDQTPLWSVGTYRGIISKIDTLFAISLSVTAKDLERFFFAARWVLSEEDPALELEEEKRWAAGLYGKTRNHSSAIREGICETLVLLAVHGNNLFQKRLGIDVEGHVNVVIRDLLKPLDEKKWLSQQMDLPRYAEAAPDEFLDILEEDLKSKNPKIHTLMKPVTGGIFGSCPRTGLLWALELLAWKPERLVRVSCILAEVSKIKLDDNWVNKPENSLKLIFRWWMPQTAASGKQLKTALRTISKKFPEIGWQICVDQFDPRSSFGHYSNRPRWRNDASGTGQPSKSEENLGVRKEAINIALAWPKHNEQTLGDLVERLQEFSDKDREKVWDLITAWNASGPADHQKSALRERTRRYAFTRYGLKRGLSTKTTDRARQAYDLLEPQDLIALHKWLFEKQWVQESYDELEEDNDYEKREKRIAKLRVDALQNIYKKQGFTGIKDLCETGETSQIIGWLLVEIITSQKDIKDFVLSLASDNAKEPLREKLDMCLAGFLGNMEEKKRTKILTDLISTIHKKNSDQGDTIVRLLKCAPCCTITWALVDSLPENLRSQYWCEVQPHWTRQTPAELERLIDELLKISRPGAAFYAAHFSWDEIGTKSIMNLLRAIASNDNKNDQGLKYDSHDISRAFKALGKRNDILKEDLAQLEFMYVQVLDHTEYRIPTLEKQVTSSPQLFMQVLAVVYKRSDDGKDPPEWLIDQARKGTGAGVSAAFRLLESLRRIPGTRDDGTIDEKDLVIWVKEVRELCEKYARKEIGDHAIGQLLSSCPLGDDEIWPCKQVRNLLEEIASKEMAKGMSIGVYNSRGVTMRGPGGDQERVLAVKYRNWAKLIAYEFPFIASSVLERIAQSYDRDAEWHDTDDKVRRRLRH